MEKFTSLLFKLNWPPRAVGLGSARPADFVCLFDSGTWVSVPEPRAVARGEGALVRGVWGRVSRGEGRRESRGVGGGMVASRGPLAHVEVGRCLPGVAIGRSGEAWSLEIQG